jgi:hypothetical protein
MHQRASGQYVPEWEHTIENHRSSYRKAPVEYLKEHSDRRLIAKKLTHDLSRISKKKRNIMEEQYKARTDPLAMEDALQKHEHDHDEKQSRLAWAKAENAGKRPGSKIYKGDVFKVWGTTYYNYKGMYYYWDKEWSYWKYLSSDFPQKSFYEGIKDDSNKNIKVVKIRYVITDILFKPDLGERTSKNLARAETWVRLQIFSKFVRFNYKYLMKRTFGISSGSIEKMFSSIFYLESQYDVYQLFKFMQQDLQTRSEEVVYSIEKSCADRLHGVGASKKVIAKLDFEEVSLELQKSRALMTESELQNR